MTDLTGKVAIVTGGATLIGAKVVEAFDAAGAKSTVADINTEDGEALAERMGDSVHFMNTDITDDGALDACIAETVERFGGIDIVVNVESSHCYRSLRTFYGEVYRVLRPGAHLLYADIGAPARIREIDVLLQETGFLLHEKCDITAQVLQALSGDEAAKQQDIRGVSIPWLLRSVFVAFFKRFFWGNLRFAKQGLNPYVYSHQPFSTRYYILIYKICLTCLGDKNIY